MSTFQGWIASLSDGSEIHETEPIPGERTPWQKLIQHCHDNSVRVTMLRLIRGQTTISTLPHKVSQGYFQAYELEQSVYSRETRLRQGIGSVVGDKVFITWMNDFGNVWQDVRDLSACRVHTTLRD